MSPQPRVQITGAVSLEELALVVAPGVNLGVRPVDALREALPDGGVLEWTDHELGRDGFGVEATASWLRARLAAESESDRPVLVSMLDALESGGGPHAV